MERKSIKRNQISNQFNSSINLDDFELLQFDILDEKEKDMNKKSNESNHKDEYRNNSTYMSSNYIYSTSTLPYNSSSQITSQIGFFPDNLNNPLNSSNTLNTFVRKKIGSSNNLNSSNYINSINGHINNTSNPELNPYNYKSSNYMININSTHHPYPNSYLYNYPQYNYQANYPTDIPIFNINNNFNSHHQLYCLKSQFESPSTSNIKNIKTSTNKGNKHITDKSNSTKTEVKTFELTQISNVNKVDINNSKNIDNKIILKKTEEYLFDNYEFLDMCREQNGSRLLQKKLDEKEGFADSLINNKTIRSCIIEMSNHQFGNYFIQKLIEKLNKLENIEFMTDQVSK